MVLVEPIPDEPAAQVHIGAERLLLIADYHAGFERAARYERGIELPSRASQRRQQVLDLIEETRADRLVVLGDLTHSIGKPGGAELAEIEVLLESVDIPVVLIKGNHDGAIQEAIAEDEAIFEALTLSPSTGTRIGPLGLVHGHTWPSHDVLRGETVCIGHEHPRVNLTDEVGGRRTDRVWLRGRLDPAVFADRLECIPIDPPELVVMPAFNELSGGTPINEPQQSYLAPFLPEALVDPVVYLLDGTRLGPLGSLTPGREP